MADACRSACHITVTGRVACVEAHSTLPVLSAITIMGLKKGTTKSAKQRANAMVAAKKAKANKENVPPANKALEKAKEETKREKKKVDMLQKQVKDQKRELKNSRDREKRHHKTAEALKWRTKLLQIRIQSLENCGMFETTLRASSGKKSSGQVDGEDEEGSFLQAGEGKVGELVKEVAGIFGVKVDKVMSRRTIRRIMLEGLVMVQVQIGHDMNATKDFTLSGDSTSRRNQNYQVHHATYRVLEVLPNGSVRVSESPRMRFLAAQNFNLSAICQKFRSMCSDHANGEKATSEAMEGVKRDETMKGLGEDRKKEMGLKEFEEVLQQWNIKKMDDAGLIVLANKANAKLVKKVVAPELGSKTPTEEEVAALETSRCGGAKTAALAGAIFNNRCDKKGQGDTHVIFMSAKLDKLVRRFPQTNNTHFGSHSEAAGELLVHLKEYCEFLEHIKMKKVSDSWTNIELNVYNALHDDPTLTELAVLALYQQLITHPYMRLVRAPEEAALNALDLGPLHGELRDHCQRLIHDPLLILDFAKDSHLKAVFDGKPFERPVVVDAIKQMVAEGKLEHLKEMFVSFIEGAKVTWLRFSSEYAPGGLIDSMSDAERSRAFMNATNDRNEGALGSWCVFARNSPSSSLQRHNALAMFSRNYTQQFVNAFFGPEDPPYALGSI
ncbi:hypothetical protein BDZ89DRAFT_1179477 [Hymenopellis radicata]|nr:hypothetical protein BDZ89DRAFT_1179477 [Hymenopellis radicata]